MSSHCVEIVELEMFSSHPNADRLRIAHIRGWRCVVGIEQFKSGRVVYIPPDYVVPLDRPEFSFLVAQYPGQATVRIRVRKFRGEISQGLLIDVPEALQYLPTGTDVMDALGIVRYEPPSPESCQWKRAPSPSGLPDEKFDVESYEAHPDIFRFGELVHITEKLHGTSARHVYADGKMHYGSRTSWWADAQDCLYVRAATDAIRAMCQANEGITFYGEVFGWVSELHYGARKGEVFFALFAARKPDGKWMNMEDWFGVASTHGVNAVPVLYSGPWDPRIARELAEGDSSWPGASNMREGVVVTPHVEGIHGAIGRVALKIISNRYMLS